MTSSEFSLNPTLVSKSTQFVDSVFPEAVGKLGDLVKIPGIAWPSFDPADLQRSAEAVRDELLALGIFDFVEIRRSSKPDGSPGAPAVLARRQPAAGAKHVLLYAHHDVQPPGDPNLWNTDPFTATLSGERLFGRGASDDKSGIITHLYALRGLNELTEELRMGVTVFIEGEEEAGSPSFLNFLEENKAELQADLIVVADSGNWSVDTPALTASLRGVVSQTFTLKTLDHALHSGMFGGPVPDAMTAMIKLLASLWDESGNVAISGLVRDQLDGPEIPLEQLREESGMLPATGRMGTAPISQALWSEPAVTIIGLDAPAVATSSNTAQPQIQARVSLRLAPSQDPQAALDLLRAHLVQHAPFGAEIEFGEFESGPGYLAKDGEFAGLMHSVLSEIWPKSSVNMGVGGSIPFISDFSRLFPAAEILVTGVEEPDSRAHSPNESQHLPTLRRAIAAETALLLHGNLLGK